MKKKTKRVIIVLGIVGVLAASPYLLMVAYLGSASVYGSIDEKVYEDEATFSAKKWREGNKKTRFSYVDALLASDLLNNEPQQKVREVLGEPDFIEDGKIWHYDTETPGWNFIDFNGGGVSVEFNRENRVKVLKDTRWTD